MSRWTSFKAIFKAAPMKAPTGVVSLEASRFAGAGGDFPRINPDSLAGRQGLGIYAQMRVDEQVKAVTTFVRDSILSRGWVYEFDKDSPLSETERDARKHIVEQIINRIPGSFIDVLNVISTGREFGFSLTEKVYELVEIDGKQWQGLRALYGRDPTTFQFYTDPYGELQRCEQNVAAQRVQIDLAKFIHYVHNPEFDRFFGRSDLREAHRSWYLKGELLKYWSLGLEKLGSGFLIAQLTPDANIRAGSAELAALQTALAGAKASASVIAPAGVTVTVQQGASMDAFKAALEYHDLAIAKALLVPNLMGVSNSGQTGSYSQSQTQLESFAWRLQADAQRLEACINEQLMRDLGDLNWGDGEYPKWCLKPLNTEQLRWLITTWTTLSGAGAVIPTEADEARLREILEMPARDEDSKTLQEVKQELMPAPPPVPGAADPAAQPFTQHFHLGGAHDESTHGNRDGGGAPSKEAAGILRKASTEAGGFQKVYKSKDANQSTSQDAYDNAVKGLHGHLTHLGYAHAEHQTLGRARDFNSTYTNQQGHNVEVRGRSRSVEANKGGTSLLNNMTEYVLDVRARGAKFSYDESQHPRAPDGEWTDGGGSSGSGKELVHTSAPHVKSHIKLTIQSATKELHKRGLTLKPKGYDMKTQRAMYEVSDKHGNTKLVGDKEIDSFLKGKVAKLSREDDGAPSAFSRAIERVDFAVIDRQQQTLSARLRTDLSKQIAVSVQRAVGEDAALAKITEDSATFELPGMDVGRLKLLAMRALADAWAAGKQDAHREMRKTGVKFKTVRDAQHFADLRDKASAYFENNGFRMAGNLADGVRAVIQLELQNSLKFGRSPAQTREAIWTRLVSKGFSTLEAVQSIIDGTQDEAGIDRALDALELATEAEGAAYLDTLARTNMFEAMNEARFAEFTDPALDGFVVAFRYSAILDSRTTDICQELHDSVYEADSAVWDQYRPPNHYNCRSLLVPITQLDVQQGTWDGEVDDAPTVQPQEGFK